MEPLHRLGRLSLRLMQDRLMAKISERSPLLAAFCMQLPQQLLLVQLQELLDKY
jgi:hypothetical protein